MLKFDSLVKRIRPFLNSVSVSSIYDSSSQVFFLDFEIMEAAMPEVPPPLPLNV